MSPLGARLAAALSPSGPAVARALHRGLAAIFFIAFASLGAQVRVLVGERGLAPFAPVARAAEARGASFLELPTLLRHFPSDLHLELGVVLGLAVSVVAFVGIRPRTCFALLTALYLSFTVACGTFLAFQWDNLLVECGLLAALLPADRPAPAVHFVLRLVLFKLYFESGIAKSQSHLGDWHDGSAMTRYYETAPLPTWVAWYAHHLPEAWHRFESRATLVWEIALPFAFFLPRTPRLLAAALVTAFQAVNVLTANYGFFSYLACVLHLVLLTDADLAAARAKVARSVGRAFPLLERLQFQPRRTRAHLRLAARRLRAFRACAHRPLLPSPARFFAARSGRAAVAVACAILVFQSAAQGLARFTPANGPAWLGSTRDALLGARDSTRLGRDVGDALRRLRLVNEYHLFGHITRERPEVEVQTSTSGGEPWVAHALRYKPGPVERPPPVVAPHQPRVDFRLWFTALGARRGVEPWVRTLLDRACHDPGAVDGLFVDPLPRGVARARLMLWDYRFTSPAERRATGHVWRRTPMGVAAEIGCRRP